MPVIRLLAAVALAALTACGVAAPAPPTRPGAGLASSQIDSAAKTAALNFITVVERVEPVAEAQCALLSRGLPCDYLIVVDDRPGLPANAFQTVDVDGRPVIGFTLSLIAEARNQDELAFILGHEAAHHIAGHLELTQATARTGAMVAGKLASLSGGDDEAVRRAVQIGAELGARTFSKEFELEADALGARIAATAGFDPVRGAAYFTRMPDPGNGFMSTHPPNADRIATVRAAIAGL